MGQSEDKTGLYQGFVGSRVGSFIASKAGLPIPPPLERFNPAKPQPNIAIALGGVGCIQSSFDDIVGRNFIATESTPSVGALVFDATQLNDFNQTFNLYDFIHNNIAKLDANGRVIILGTSPERCDPSEKNKAIVQRGLIGFMKSLAKELRQGSTCQLVYISEKIQRADDIRSTLKYLLSGKSAYTHGQVITVSEPDTSSDTKKKASEPSAPLAVVTGAARGIGAEIARILHRDGFRLLLLDVPAMEDKLKEKAAELSAYVLCVDITEDIAAESIFKVTQELGGIDVLVHNAGVIRDKLIYNMTPEQWEIVVKVNIEAPISITDYLLEKEAINSYGRIISISSISGISGVKGQTNYSFTKAAVIGFVESYAERLAHKNITINAVAPGYIETDMTATIPAVNREMIRFLATLQQGGKPVDIAEAVAYFADPRSGGVTGNVLRVCGQNIVGA